MLLHEYGELVNNLFMYFRNKDKPEDGQLRMWYRECEYIPATARRSIFDAMVKEKSLPFNLPRAIKQHYYRLQQETGVSADKKEVPVGVLFEAARVLEKNGMDSFAAYCDGHNISDKDRDRIVANVYYDFKLTRHETPDKRTYYKCWQKDKKDSEWTLVKDGHDAAARVKNPVKGDFDAQHLL